MREILFADYAFLNRELARHYGVDRLTLSASDSRAWSTLAATHRGGLLGLGAVLTVTSAPLRTSPVKRGDWVLRRVLGTPVPPPPADAGSIPADDVLADGKTVRQRLEAHRRNPSCVNCHSRIDPLGFALEHYDPLGRWREHVSRRRADRRRAARWRTARRSPGPTACATICKTQQQQFHRTLCTQAARLCAWAAASRSPISS